MTFEEYWKANKTPNINWGPQMYKEIAEAAWNAALPQEVLVEYLNKQVLTVSR